VPVQPDYDPVPSQPVLGGDESGQPLGPQPFGPGPFPGDAPRNMMSDGTFVHPNDAWENGRILGSAGGAGEGVAGAEAGAEAGTVVPGVGNVVGAVGGAAIGEAASHHHGGDHSSEQGQGGSHYPYEGWENVEPGAVHVGEPTSQFVDLRGEGSPGEPPVEPK
jgi:hypothetical protein